MLNNSMSLSNKRNDFFDVLKGIGILCVFYGHTAYWGTLPSRMVFSFHMPLFFLISGIFFHIEKIPNWGSLVRKVWRNLLLPYCFFVIVGCLITYDLTITRWLSRPLSQCGRIIHGEGADSIWFLVCLATVQFLAWVISHSFTMRDSDIMKVCLLFAGLITAHCIYLFLPKKIIKMAPFMLASVPAAMVFFSFGQLFAKQLYDYGYSKIRCNILIINR